MSNGGFGIHKYTRYTQRRQMRACVGVCSRGDTPLLTRLRSFAPPVTTWRGKNVLTGVRTVSERPSLRSPVARHLHPYYPQFGDSCQAISDERYIVRTSLHVGESLHELCSGWAMNWKEFVTTPLPSPFHFFSGGYRCLPSPLGSAAGAQPPSLHQPDRNDSHSHPALRP